MSISAETYIVISLMFAVFAAVAAVGTSVVLGAGFERLRAGFEVVRRQSGFFADAIYKLDQRTQKLDEETAKLKAGLSGMDDRMGRAEKTATFLADSITSIEHRILQGSPAQMPVRDNYELRMNVGETTSHRPAVKVQPVKWERVPAPEQTVARMQDALSSGLYSDYPANEPFGVDEGEELPSGLAEEQGQVQEGGLTTLLSRYFLGESSGSSKGVVYH